MNKFILIIVIIFITATSACINEQSFSSNSTPKPYFQILKEKLDSAETNKYGVWRLDYNGWRPTANIWAVYSPEEGYEFCEDFDTTNAVRVRKIDQDLDSVLQKLDFALWYSVKWQKN